MGAQLSVAALAMLLSVIIIGCGGSSASRPQAGPILMTDANGMKAQVISLAQAATLRLSMMPVGDVTQAGVDWIVTCGGNPVTGSVGNGACGTLTPAHTAGGAATSFTAPSVVPIGTSVTITASVTSNPSQNSNVSLTIVALPVSVSFFSAVPASMALSATINPIAQVTNDPLGTGVMWSANCGSTACGSFNPIVTSTLISTSYTAPAIAPGDGAVTLTATSLTDTTKSASVTVKFPIATPTEGVTSLNISPSSAYVSTTGAAHTISFTPVATSNIAAAGFDWTVSCGASNCGRITSAHTASGVSASFQGPTAVPPGGTVTITATSTSVPTVSTTAIATITTTAPIVVTMSTTPPATLTTGSQTTLSATTSTGNLGVDWTATCGSVGACGSFSLLPAHTASAGKITYTAPGSVPAGNIVTITASSPATTPSNPSIARTTIVVPPPTPPMLSFALSPPASLEGGTQASVSAVVTNDVPPGGVTWTLQCNSTVSGGCGSIVPYQTSSGGTATYTAPPVMATGTTVTIVATSTASSKVSLSSTPIAINPPTSSSVNFVPLPPSQVQANSTVNVAAAVNNDVTNAGVDWKICSSGCGFFTTQIAIPAIPATLTTPYVPAVPAVTATSVTAWPNNLPLLYTAPPQPPSSGSVVIFAASHATPATANSANISISSTANGPALHGIVLAGLQPVAGSSVALYAAGTSGYGSASTKIASDGGTFFSTDEIGNFTIPAGYDCPKPDSQMYLVATGGHIGTSDPNPNLALMTALGGCNGLSSSPMVLNEVTSVASAWATAAFAANDALDGNSSYLYLGTSSSNLSGLANAFAAVNNLVDISNGQARFNVPAGSAAVPYVEINTLADLLNACTVTAGGVEGDGSVCGTLFTDTDVLSNHSLFNSIAPLDTLQAAFNIAQHPGSNYGYQVDQPQTLFSLATLASPFQPILTTKPSDWSISLNYKRGGGLSNASTVGSFAIDGAGDLWITDTKAGTAIKWNAVGAAISPSGGFPAGGGPIAIDSAGNAWISGKGSLSELTSLGFPIPGTPFGGVTAGGGDLAIDAQSNLWITTSSGIAEFNSLGMALSPIDGYTNSAITSLLPVTIDNSNNVWVGSAVTSAGNNYALAELTNPGGQLIVNSAQALLGLKIMSQIASDSAGNIWTSIPDVGGVCMVPPYAGKGTVLLPTCYAGGGASSSAFAIFDAEGVALDGLGTVWVASRGGGTGTVVPPSVLPLAPSLLEGSNKPNPLSSPSLAAGPMRVAVDGSGNLWVLLADNTVTEYISVATPVVTPIAVGVQTRKIAARP